MEVKSLYTSTANHEGIAAVKKRYDKRTNKTVPLKIITFLALILTFNNFIFNSKFYLQIQGRAIETGYESIYAKINLCIKTNNKKWRPDKNHHTIETCIEATKNTLETEEQNNNKNKYYNN